MKLPLLSVVVQASARLNYLGTSLVIIVPSRVWPVEKLTRHCRKLVPIVAIPLVAVAAPKWQHILRTAVAVLTWTLPAIATLHRAHAILPHIEAIGLALRI